VNDASRTPEPESRPTAADVVPDGVPDHAEIVALPPLVYLGALVAGLLTQGAVGGWITRDLVVRLGLGSVLVLLGAAGTLWSARRFEDAGEERGPLTPTHKLVIDGPYARSRNPAYLSLTLAYVGLALLLNNPWMLVYLIPVLVLIHYGVVLREERYLERKFGEDYLDYKSKVRRWL
jgi:protein-S-isoprenylcysteine O-methyltransferase Ste14